MSTGALDPMIHDPGRLRIVATLAALPDGDALSVTRLQDMLGLTPGSLITRLRELGNAGYVRTEKTGDDSAPTTVALTCGGRGALDRYTAVLRQLPRVAREDHQAPAPDVRAGDADRDAAAAALGEHFAQGRLTLDELNARLDATLTATTHGELSQAARDLPDLTVLSARVSFSRGKRARPGHKPGPAPGQGAWPHRRGWTPGGSSRAKTGSTRSSTPPPGRA
jgi:DNA-binding transcriptional ArsR family regulator